MADSNYYLFFKLYRDAPAMGACLMDYCVDRLRKVALTIMTKVRVTRSMFAMVIKCMYCSEQRCVDVAAMLPTDRLRASLRRFVRSSPCLPFSIN